MRKIILTLFFVLMFFGCASTDSKTIGNTEIPEITPEIIPNEEVIHDEILFGQEYIENSDTTFEEEIENINNPNENLEEESDTREEPFLFDEPSLEEEFLIINPEKYESPDYVEFLPISEEEVLTEENAENQVDEEVLTEENVENQVDEEALTESAAENQVDEEVLTEENVENQIDEEALTEGAAENQVDEEVLTEENVENQVDEEALTESAAENQVDEEVLTEENAENQVDEEEVLTEENAENQVDEEEVLTEDIPLEEIFTPDANFEPLEPEETASIQPNRTMKINTNQILKITFPGSNWIYLGDEYNSDTLVFEKRDIYEESTEFQLKTVKAGEALLHFFRQDLLTNEPIDDYLLVTVNSKKGKMDIVEAPEYVFSTLEKTTEVNEEDNFEEYYDYEYDFIEEEPEVIIFEDNLFFEDATVSKKEIIDLATSFFQDKFYYETLDQLNYYFEILGNSTDEYTDYALFLKGQLLELQSPLRNIKESLNAYKTLVENFPDSQYWDTANKRITYLERFYFSVR